MNCMEIEQRLSIDPRNIDDAAQAHINGCASCKMALTEALAFEEQIRIGFEVPTAALDKTLSVIPRSMRIVNRRQMLGGGMAAALAGLAYWYSDNVFPSLPQEIVKLIDPSTFAAAEPIPTELLRTVLNSAGAMLVQTSIEAVYGSNCSIRGRIAAHLVLKSSDGPVSAFLMPSVPVGAVESFELYPWVGRVTPFDQGSLAVVGITRAGCDATDKALRSCISFKRA